MYVVGLAFDLAEAVDGAFAALGSGIESSVVSGIKLTLALTLALALTLTLTR